MSHRDYRLVIKLEIDRQSLNELASKLSDAIQKAFGRALGVGRGGAVRGVSVDREAINSLNRIVRSLDRISTRLAGVEGALSRAMRRRRERRERRRRERESPLEKFRGVLGREARAIFGGRAFGAMAGAFRGIGAMVGVLSTAVAIGMAIFEVVKYIANKAAEFSGYFKASMKLLDTVIALFLKPIADVVGVLLRPFLMMLLPVAILINRITAPIIAQLSRRLSRMSPQELVKFFLEFLFGVVPGARIGIELGSWLAELIKGNIKLEGLKKAWDDIVSGLSGIFGGVAPKIAGALSGFSSFLQAVVLSSIVPVGEAVGRFVGWIKDNLGDIGKKLGDTWNSFTGWIRDKLGGIGGAIGNAWNDFVNWIKNNLGFIGGKIGEAWGNFISWIKDNIGKIADWVGQGWNNFVNWIKDNLGKIGEWIGSGWNALVSFFNSVKNTIQWILRPVWDAFVGTIEWIKKKLDESGVTDLVIKIINIISQIAGWLGIGGGGARGQFGLTVPAAGPYFLEPGEIVLSRSDVMRLVSFLTGAGERAINVNVSVTVEGDVYGMRDFEDVVSRIISERVGNILYDIARRGVR